MSDQLINFDPSQRRFFEDESRVVVVCWHRQKGKDFVAAAKAVDHAMRTGQNWFIVSLTQRQADATFDKCRKVFDGFKTALKWRGQATVGGWQYDEYDRWIDQHFVAKARELILPNGAKIVSLPGRDPDTLAGLTGNVIFTEFGLFPGGGYDHWRVVFPLCTRGYSVIVISTPRGKNTKFFELFADAGTYSVHQCDILKSVEEDGYILRDNAGRVCSIEEFRKLYGDESGWQREYMCQFTGDLDALVKWNQLISAGQLGSDKPFNYLRLDEGRGWEPSFFDKSPLRAYGLARLEIGWDVARTTDLSVVWANGYWENHPRSLRYLVIMSKCEFELQRTVICTAMKRSWNNVGCGDKTGLGMDSNETLTKLFPGRWEGIDFGGTRKKELASALRTAYGDGDQAIPPVDGPYKFIATDLYAIQKDESGGKMVLAETENPLLEESHCDIAWACALARRAVGLKNARPLPAPMMSKPEGW